MNAETDIILSSKQCFYTYNTYVVHVCMYRMCLNTYVSLINFVQCISTCWNTIEKFELFEMLQLSSSQTHSTFSFESFPITLIHLNQVDSFNSFFCIQMSHICRSFVYLYRLYSVIHVSIHFQSISISMQDIFSNLFIYPLLLYFNFLYFCISIKKLSISYLSITKIIYRYTS